MEITEDLISVSSHKRVVFKQAYSKVMNSHTCSIMRTDMLS